MKVRRILTNVLLAGTLAIGQNLFFVSSQNQAKAQSSRPYIVLVNGWRNCCAHGIYDRIKSIDADFRFVPYSNFNDGGTSNNTSTDEQFLRDGADYINNQLDRNRPLILIGHSFGGDSVLKLLPRINRRIQFVGVIDPVSTGGFRNPLTRSLAVGSNVDYFFNRWQENVPFPNDFGTNGTIPCSASRCDQKAQNLARSEDGSTKTIECRWDEVTCPGFVAPNPLIGRRGQKGRKQVRVGHQDLAKDAYVHRILRERISSVLASFRSPALPRIGYFDNGATVFYSTGSSYCGFASPNHYRFFQQVNSATSLGRQDPGSFGTYTGACPLPSGYFDNGATVFFSQGNGTFCGFSNPQSYDSHGRARPQLPRFGRMDTDPNSFMSYVGVCQ